jgi:DNA-binding protein H-NS
MASLLDIQTQIEKLQKQASEIKDREFDSTVQDILTKMQAFGITIKDLQRAYSQSWKSVPSRRTPRPRRAARWLPPNTGVPMARAGVGVG